MRTLVGDESVRRGRLNKAMQFQRVAKDALALVDSRGERLANVQQKSPSGCYT